MSTREEFDFWKRFADANASRPDRLHRLSELVHECAASGEPDDIVSSRIEFLSRFMRKRSELDGVSFEQIDMETRDTRIYSRLSELTPNYSLPDDNKQELGIVVFGFTRQEELKNTLTSLQRQGEIANTEVWLDGDQGKQSLRDRIQSTSKLVAKFPVKHLHEQRGNYGFRKMILMALLDMSRRYRDVIILEDDCFPTRNAIAEFRKELDEIRNNPQIFSVYGAHFGVEGEMPLCSRFQGWGWATTSEKLRPVLRMLSQCYSLNESAYLAFVDSVSTCDVLRRLEITPGRQPSQTLKHFFAWDETLALLTAVRGQFHKPTEEQVIYNCGLGGESTHFPDKPMFRQPPFNMIRPSEVWSVF